MKYLSSLLPVIFLAACNQYPDQTTDPSPYEKYLATKPDSISSGVQTIIEMNDQASTDAYNARHGQSNENIKWQYDLPMPGNTYQNTNSASLKANDVNAYLKLVNGKDINMVVLKLEDSQFFEDQSMVQDVQIQFDTTEPKVYTCSIDPLFKFLVIEPYEEIVKKIKKSHSVIIQAVIQKNAYRSVVGYENRRVSTGYSYRGRRRRWSNERVPVTITKTEIKPANQTWVFKTSGLVWKY
jgi:hypothetical protein